MSEQEMELCKANGIQWYELILAQDAIAVVINSRNSFVTDLSIVELQLIWKKNSPIRTWNDIRVSWPKEEIKLFGPGMDSGTRDYFSEVLFGNTTDLRTDYEMSEDDDELEHDVENEPFALSFFGITYVARNNNQVKIIGVQENGKSIYPNYTAIQSRTYPLSRSLYLHINMKTYYSNPALIDFVTLYIRSLNTLCKAAGYIPLDARLYKRSLDELAGNTVVLSR